MAALEAERARSLRLRQRDDAAGSRSYDAEPGDVVDAGRATRAADGVNRCSSGNGVTIGSPNASTKRQAMVVAAFTVTCCPRIALRPISNPLKAPGRAGRGCP